MIRVLFLFFFFFNLFFGCEFFCFDSFLSFCVIDLLIMFGFFFYKFLLMFDLLLRGFRISFNLASSSSFLLFFGFLFFFFLFLFCHDRVFFLFLRLLFCIFLIFYSFFSCSLFCSLLVCLFFFFSIFFCLELCLLGSVGCRFGLLFLCFLHLLSLFLVSLYLRLGSS